MITLTPAAHRSLVVSEIFRLIAGSFCKCTRKRALASLARTCKTLYAAATPKLWKHQDSLVPLLRLLPPDTWTEDTLPSGGSVFKITVTDPKQLDWTRFDYYAEHVQHLIWEERQDVSLLALTAIAMSRHHDKQRLLPKLRTLDWLEPRATHSPFIHLFLTPTIRHLGLMASDVDPSVSTALFEHLGAICKRIDSLKILQDAQDDDMQELTGVVGHAFARLLRGLPELKSFVGELFVPADCVEALASLSRLQEVAFYVKQQEVDILAKSASAVRFSRNAQWFDTLEVLELGTDRMDDSESWKTFLNAMPMGKLWRVLIKSRLQPDTDTVKQHLELVARAASRDSLTSLQLDFNRMRSMDSSYPVLDVGEALRPLYAFPHLDTLIVRAPALVVPTSALRDIAHAWRELKTLSLMSDHPHPRRNNYPCLALEDLVPLVRNCSRLDTLALHVSAYDFVLPDAAALTRLLPEPSRSPLRVFTACDAAIENSNKAADVLAHLFPGLREVQYGGTVRFVGDAHVAYERKWKAAQALLTARLDTSERSSPTHRCE